MVELDIKIWMTEQQIVNRFCEVISQIDSRKDFDLITNEVLGFGDVGAIESQSQVYILREIIAKMIVCWGIHEASA